MKKKTAAIAATVTILALTQLWPDRDRSQDAVTSQQSSSRAPVRPHEQAPMGTGIGQAQRGPHERLNKGDVVTGRVVKVSDGDTITLLREDKTQLKIRMLGIDAPEKSQPFGEVCRDQLARQIAGKDVAVQVGTLDRYGRTIGKISVDGKDVNLSQIEAGCAWHYKDYVRNQPPADRELYAEKELAARDQKVGLWKDAHPQEPWLFRKNKRSGKDSE